MNRSNRNSLGGLRKAAFCVVLPLVILAFFSLPPSFAEGEKRLRVRVAEYPWTFEGSFPQGGEWELGGRSGRIPNKGVFKVTGKLMNHAVKKYHVMVESVPLREPQKVAAAMEKWKATGRPLHTMEIGSQSFSEDGRTVIWDGRIVMIGVGVFASEAQAQALVDELAAGSSSSWIYVEVVRRSEGGISLRVGARDVAMGNSLLLKPVGLVRLLKVEHAKGYSWHGYADREFRGKLTCQWGADDSIDCVLETGMETILAGVVPAEISSKAAPAALCAQAVAARGEILSKAGLRHINEGFEFCSEQHCQVFSGESAESVAVGRKIAPTRGLVLTSPDGAIVDAVYAANCGGHGEANHLVWTTTEDPVLQGVWDCDNPPNLDLTKEKDAVSFILKPPPCYCKDPTVEGGDKFRWSKTLSDAEWKAVVEAAGVGRLKKVSDFVRGKSGRIYRLTLTGEKGTRTIMKELNIRKLFGGLRSACFIVAWTWDNHGFLSGAKFTGAGWGHGVGMCQTGAQALAKKGMGFEPILLHYFPGSKLVKFY